MGDIIYIRLDMFINNNACFAILYGSIMFYIYKNIFIWKTHHATNAQLYGQLIQTMMMFDINQALAWTEYDSL